MMRSPDSATDDNSIGDRLGAGVRRFLRRRIPEKWRGRLGLLRGVFVKDPGEQLGRILKVARHFGDYRRVDRALFYHRFAANLILAYRLGIFEALSEGAREAREIAEFCEIEKEAAKNLLQILHSQGYVSVDGERYSATAFASEFFDSNSSVSMTPMFDVCGAYARAFPEFFEAARSGRTPSTLDIYDEAACVDELLDGVNYYIDQAARELMARVEWPAIEHFIVGSMGVSFSSLVLSKFPTAQVTYGCLPHLVERIPRLREEYDVAPNRVVEMHAHGGEPAEDQWGREAFDLVFLTKKMVLDPANDLGRKFARKSYQVLNPEGVAVFWETIYDDEAPANTDRGMEGFLDFGVSPTGPVLTNRGFQRFLTDIGYRDVEVVSCLEGATTFVVARK